MAVAQVIGRLRQLGRIDAFDVQHLLRLRDDLDHAPVGSGHQVAAAQDLAARQHQAHLFSRDELRVQAALLPQVERQLELAANCNLVGGARHLQF